MEVNQRLEDLQSSTHSRRSTKGFKTSNPISNGRSTRGCRTSNPPNPMGGQPKVLRPPIPPMGGQPKLVGPPIPYPMGGQPKVVGPPILYPMGGQPKLVGPPIPYPMGGKPKVVGPPTPPIQREVNERLEDLQSSTHSPHPTHQEKGILIPSGLVVDPHPEIWQVMPGTGQLEANGNGLTC